MNPSEGKNTATRPDDTLACALLELADGDVVDAGAEHAATAATVSAAMAQRKNRGSVCENCVMERGNFTIVLRGLLSLEVC